VLSNEANHWLTRHVAPAGARVVNCWAQTESGGVLLASLPQEDPVGAHPGGLAPLPGVDVAVHDSRLMVESAWPGMAIGLVEGGEAYDKAYFQTRPGCFDTGDQVRNTLDNAYVIEGRAGEMGSSGACLAAIETAVASHPDVAEVAALSGEPVRVFVTLRAEADALDTGEDLEDTLAALARAAATCPFSIRIVEDLPKTRSGKIARQALRQAAEGLENLGDTSLIDDPSVLSGLFEGKDKLFG
jgi:acetyl-CoA synthetase